MNANQISMPSFKENSFDPESITSSISTSGTGLWEKIKSMGIIPWIVVIVIILAFLGFNIFTYLSQGTQSIVTIFKPLFGGIVNLIRSITGETLIIGAEGGKTVVNAVSDVANVGLDGIENVGEDLTPDGTNSNSTGGGQATPKTASSSLSNDSVTNNNANNNSNNNSNNAVNQALNSSQKRSQQNSQDYEADEANSTIQGGGKGGWCYIGEDRGFRSCAQVNASDMCMSGDIFPTQEICVNPNLRY